MLQVGVAMLHMGVTIWVLKKEGTQLDGSLVKITLQKPYIAYVHPKKKLYQKICVKSIAWLQVATIMANSYKIILVLLALPSPTRHAKGRSEAQLLLGCVPESSVLQIPWMGIGGSTIQCFQVWLYVFCIFHCNITCTACCL